MKKFLAFTNKNSIELLWSNYFKTKEVNNKGHFLCSVSGGQDSIINFLIIFYLFSFQHKKNKLIKPEMKILYFQHFLQLKNFFLPLFLFRFSFIFQTPYLILLPTTLFLTENEARNWRKKNSLRICQFSNSSYFFTGHTETDLVEKNLNNMLRGTSPNGLIDQKFLYHPNSQIFLFSSIFINSIWSSNSGKKTRGFNKKLYFLKQNSFFFSKNSVGLKTKVFRTNKLSFSLKQRKKSFEKDSESRIVFFTKYIFSKNTVFSKKIFLFGTDVFFYQTIHFKTEHITFYSNSFSFYNKHYFRKINLTKPLESVRRSTISELSTFFDFPLLIDLTNYSKIFSRNRIRHEMLPFMKSLYHKKIEKSLKNFFHLVRSTSPINKMDIGEYYFLYNIFPLLNRNQIKSTNLLNKNLNKKIQSSFLQKLIVDSKNIELTFSQLSFLEKKIFF